MRPTTLARIVLLTTSVVLVAPAVAQVSTTPSTQTMIEQLRAPRTRSLRNLTVEQVPVTGEATTSPATSTTATPANDAQAAATTATTTPAQTGASAAVALPTALATRPALSLLIQFVFNSARVRPESQHVLANLSQALQSAELVSSKFAVEGHTDAKGTADYNLRLSELRAAAVRDFLKARGVSEERLVASGKGASELANSSEPFAAENRRVRIVNLD